MSNVNQQSNYLKAYINHKGIDEKVIKIHNNTDSIMGFILRFVEHRPLMITDTSDNMLVEYNQDAIGFSPIFPDDLFEEFQDKLSAMYQDSGLMFQVMCSFKEYEEVQETA